MFTFELPKAEQLIDDWSPSQKVGNWKNMGTFLYPSPWSNFWSPSCLANYLNPQKIHMSIKAHRADLIFLMMTNLIKAPATMIAIILLRNQASLSSSIKKSVARTAREKVKPNKKATLFFWQQSINKSWLYITRQTS